MSKEFTVVVHRRGRETAVTKTMAELVEYFGYTLEVGKSWEHEKGNKKVNRSPKTLTALVANLNKSADNAARNGSSSTYYTEGGE